MTYSYPKNMYCSNRLSTIWFTLIYLLNIFNGSTSQTDQSKSKKQSFIQSSIFDMLRKSVGMNYVPDNPTDIFDFLRDSYPLPNGLKAPYTEYDYIIVGAGSAGCVLAARLSEDPNIQVLVVEAGRPEMFTTDIPAIAPFFQRTEYVWPYYMEPQRGVCMGMINKRCFWPRGRAVGGTSVINYMIYTRGHPEDWDRIEADGNYGWSYEEVLKYYKRSERANLNGLENSPYHGQAGEMNVEFGLRSRLADVFLEAGRIMGYPSGDYNAPEQLSFGYVQATTQGGRRVSAAKAFLHGIKNRPNLHILPMTRVTKVLIEKGTKIAYGVEYIRNRNRFAVKARREVILSAGPIASPQLLMLSGIGPRKHLEQHKIPVIKNLPVGRTLYDHITFPGLIFTLNVTNISLIESRLTTFRNIIQYLQFSDSPASSAGAVDAIGYIKTALSNRFERRPDIELISIGGSLVSDGGGGSKAVRRGMMISEEGFDAAYGSIDNTDTWSAFPMLLHPKSVGYLELKDNNPFSYPRMYGNYLTDPMDVSTFIEAIRFIQALASTEPFQRLGARVHPAVYPTCRKLPFASDAYWECAVRTLTATLHHQVATCRMGPANDSFAIVDPELRVYGVKRLRVVDSGILPNAVSAHTHGPAVMIGEKASDMIRATWKTSL